MSRSTLHYENAWPRCISAWLASWFQSNIMILAKVQFNDLKALYWLGAEEYPSWLIKYQLINCIISIQLNKEVKLRTAAAGQLTCDLLVVEAFPHVAHNTSIQVYSISTSHAWKPPNYNQLLLKVLALSVKMKNYSCIFM